MAVAEVVAAVAVVVVVVVEVVAVATVVQGKENNKSTNRGQWMIQ